MNSPAQRPVNPWPFIVLFFVISATAIVSGLLFYRSQKKHILQSRTQELSVIADLKVKQIIQWRGERISDGNYLSQNLFLRQQLSRFLTDGRNKKLHDYLIQDLRVLTESYDYRTALFIDNNCNVKLFYPGRDTVLGDYLKSRLPGIIKKGEIVLTDLHQTGLVSFVHLDLLVPLKNNESESNEVFGLLVLRIDPQKVLYPLIRSWPVTSKTSETLLLRSAGDKAEYLSEQRHLRNSGTFLNKPADQWDLAASMAIQGIKESTDAVDYRGVHVIATMKKVPDSPWYMVAKVDREEIFNEIYGQVKSVIIIVILFILTTGSFLGFLLWNQRVRFYRGKYEAELNRLALIRHFDYILKYANDIILLTDRDYKIVEANDKATEAYNYSRQELIGMNVNKLRAGDPAGRLSDDIKIIDDSKHATFETVHIRKDGTVFPIEISARLVDIEGVKYYQSIGRDITERKKAEESLRESEELFRKVFEDSPLGMVMTGKDLGILNVNSAFCKMLGYKEDELLGMTFRNFTHPDYISGDELSILRLVAEEIPIYHTEKKYIRSDGAVIWASTTVCLIRNNKSEVQFFLAMVEDISERKKAESELIAAKEKAEEGDRLKTAFLHNVSHEIRTPMNAILGFSTLLNEPGVSNADRKQFTDVIIQSGNQLLSIINDIVDLANIESGQVKLNMKEINLNTTLKRINEQFSYKEIPDKIALDLSAPLPEKDADIVTDSTKLVQVISNLINNAFKFTKKGRIDFGYSLKEGFLEFFVKDTGIGIPHEHQSRIFDRFYQVDSAISRQFTGTGLGLSICKAYVELLGGTIGVTSEPGKGTTFIFTIPYIKKGEYNPGKQIRT